MGRKPFGHKFKIISTDKFYLAVPNDPGRWKHLASITLGVREFVFLEDTRDGRRYIEEITGGHLEKIDDDPLWHALMQFIDNSGLNTVVTSSKGR